MEPENREVRHHEGGELLSMAAEELNLIDVDTQKVDPSTPEDMTVDEINARLFAVLMAPASNEAFDTAHGAGLGEWRCSHRRHGPGKASRSCGFHREI